MRKIFVRKAALAVVAALAFPLAVFANVGVGVGLGKVILEEPLKPGTIYDLPTLPVINTGDELTEYEAFIEYQENVPQLRPGRDWVTFTPRTFSLEPGKVQPVTMTLRVPLNAKPGEYYAFLEARPLRKARTTGGASIGVAAASKFYFTVAPSNIFQAVFYRITSLIARYRPWTYIVFGFIGFVLLAAAFKKFFKLEFAISRKS
ncbi:MAG: hypothetical protein WC866_02565 [Patescibacteria group bacterium]|jgi:hypothetical protein